MLDSPSPFPVSSFLDFGVLVVCRFERPLISSCSAFTTSRCSASHQQLLFTVHSLPAVQRSPTSSCSAFTHFQLRLVSQAFGSETVTLVLRLGATLYLLIRAALSAYIRINALTSACFVYKYAQFPGFLCHSFFLQLRDIRLLSHYLYACGVDIG